MKWGPAIKDYKNYLHIERGFKGDRLPGFSSSENSLFPHASSHVALMRPITKYTHQIVGGDNVPTRVREAFRLAEEERPGATHLELPEDIAAEDVDTPLLTASAVRRPIAEEKSIRSGCLSFCAASWP